MSQTENRPFFSSSHIQNLTNPSITMMYSIDEIIVGTLQSYLLSIEMERLLLSDATVSLFSLLIVGREEKEEEEKMEAGDVSFIESKGR